MGNIDAVAAVCAGRLVVRRAISRMCVSKSTIAVNVVLLILGAIAWIPIVLGLGALAAVACLTIWALVASLWLADVSPMG